MAASVGISEATVRRIWHADGLKSRTLARIFTVSNDPGICRQIGSTRGSLNPQEHAVVLCVDEKSQIQVLNRTQPG